MFKYLIYIETPADIAKSFYDHFGKSIITPDTLCLDLLAFKRDLLLQKKKKNQGYK